MDIGVIPGQSALDSSGTKQVGSSSLYWWWRLDLCDLISHTVGSNTIGFEGRGAGEAYGTYRHRTLFLVRNRSVSPRGV